MKRADIQALRGIAVSAVIAAHFGGMLPGGFLGVDVFFAISGYVIFLSLTRLLDENSVGKGLAEFWKRRFWRLVPALSVVLLFTGVFAFALLTPRGFKDQLEMIGWSTFFAGNVGVEVVSKVDYFDPAAEQNWLLHLWSLGVEEQFYLIFPLAMALIVVIRNSSRRALLTGIVLVALTIGSLAAAFLDDLALIAGSDNALLNSTGISAALGYYSPLTRAWEFSLGAMAAAFFSEGRGARANLAPLGSLFVALSLIFFPESMTHPGPLAIVPLVGVFFILARSQTSPAPIWSKFKPLIWLGDRSYSLYLWHWPIWSILNVLLPGSPGTIGLSLLLTVLLADRTFRWIEVPLMKRPKKGEMPLRKGRSVSPKKLLLGGAFLLSPLSLALVFQITFTSLADAGLLRQAIPVPQVEPSIDCLQTSCTDQDFAVLLVGDSHAGALSTALYPTLMKEGVEMRAAILNRSFGCLHLPSTSIVSIHDQCRELSNEVRETLETATPEVLVIYGYTAGRFTTTNSGKRRDIELIDTRSGDLVSEDDAAAAYQSALAETVDFAQSLGIRVVVISGTPDFDFRPEEVDRAGNEASIAKLVLSARGGTLLGGSTSISAQSDRHGTFRDIEVKLAGEVEGLDVIDPWPLFCENKQCTQTDSKGSFYYSDHDHLSPFGAELLSQLVAPVILSELQGDESPTS